MPAGNVYHRARETWYRLSRLPDRLPAHRGLFRHDLVPQLLRGVFPQDRLVPATRPRLAKTHRSAQSNSRHRHPWDKSRHRHSAQGKSSHHYAPQAKTRDTANLKRQSAPLTG